VGSLEHLPIKKKFSDDEFNDILFEFHDPDNIESFSVIEYELAFCSE